MKKKPNYSLTSAQRKEQKKKQEQKQEIKQKGGSNTVQINNEIPLTDDQIVALETQQAEKRKKRKLTLVITAICLACVIGLGGVITGIWLGVRATVHDNFGLSGEPVPPIATIHLSTNQQIEITLNFYQNQVPVANFIFLSLSGFFDNTIFHNGHNQQGFVGFSGFTSPTTHRAEDRDFLSRNIRPAFSSDRSPIYGNPNFVLGYRITNTANTINRPRRVDGQYDPSGYFAFMASDNATAGSSTSFLMIHDSSAELLARRATTATGETINNVNMGSHGASPINSLSYIGRMSDESIAIVRGIANRSATNIQPAANRLNRLINQYYFNEAIYINRITFRNLDRSLRRNIMNNFETFVLDPRHEIDNPNALLGGRMTTWRRTEIGTWNPPT